MVCINILIRNVFVFNHSSRVREIKLHHNFNFILAKRHTHIHIYLFLSPTGLRKIKKKKESKKFSFQFNYFYTFFSTLSPAIYENDAPWILTAADTIHVTKSFSSSSLCCVWARRSVRRKKNVSSRGKTHCKFLFLVLINKYTCWYKCLFLETFSYSAV